jgi:hypothetical protein
LKVREVKRELSRTMRTQLRNLTTRLREYNNMKVRHEEVFASKEIKFLSVQSKKFSSLKSSLPKKEKLCACLRRLAFPCYFKGTVS